MLSRSAPPVFMAVLLASCAAPPQPVWYHSSGTFNQQRFSGDDSICTSLAYRSIGGPPQAQAGGSTTSFSGQTSTGTTFQGESRTVPANQMFGTAAGFQAYEAQANYNQAIRSVHRGCMAERGWSLQYR